MLKIKTYTYITHVAMLYFFSYFSHITNYRYRLINSVYMYLGKITCDQIPTVHRGADDWGDVCVDVCLISSHAGISHTSLVGKFLGSVQAPSAILIINDVLTSCTHSSSRVRIPLPQEVEQSLHGPPRHLRKYSCYFEKDVKKINILILNKSNLK